MKCFAQARTLNWHYNLLEKLYCDPSKFLPSIACECSYCEYLDEVTVTIYPYLPITPILPQ